MLNFLTNSCLVQSTADVLAADKDIAAGNRTVFLSIALLLFAVILLILMTYLIANKEKSAESVLRSFGIMLIITSAVFLVVAGYPANELVPVIGLLGTIAGYLLGRTTEKPGYKKNADEKPLARAPEGSESGS